jgi:type VI secretion system protein ImpL
MKNLIIKTWAVLRQTWAWTLLAVLSLAAFVWFVGPLVAVAEHRLLEEATARLAAISLMLLGWGLAMAFVGRRAEVDEAVLADKREDAAIVDQRTELLAGFKEAERVLSESGLYAGRDSWARRELPWYLLIGPHASGKTSLLDFSGLDFPLNRPERRLTRDLQGSRGCDWYFNDQAVVLDTAGRYFSQTQPRVDASAWLDLLGLLRTRRRARPIDGVLVTLPVEELFGTQELRLEQFAATVRDRLQEVRRQLRMEVPVYLILSRADAVPGFDEFFDPLSREEIEQVLGATFNKDQNGTDAQVVRQTFEALLSRLNAQVLSRIHQERGARRRSLILDFPQQLGRIGHALCLFVELAFAGNRYQPASRLRGYYLTRAPHVSVLTSEEQRPADGPQASEGQRLPMLSTGRARFIHNVLGRVIFPESGLATFEKSLLRRFGWLRRAGFAAVATTLLLCGAVWALGFSANHERLEQLRDLAGQWREQRSAVGTEDDVLAILVPLNTLYNATRVFPDAQQVSLTDRSGLYQGAAANQVLSDVYRAELRSQLLPRVARQLEARITGSLQDREQLLASLRAYLMLGSGKRRDPVWLADRIAVDWAERYAGQGQAQQELKRHLQRLLEQPFEQPLNPRLVAQARQVLRGESLASVVYRALREQARETPDYRLASRIGDQERVFGGADYPIPGFYTREGYERYFLVHGSGTISEILHDNWVLGDSIDVGPIELRRLLMELEQLYFRDYAEHWSEALGRVELQPLEGARQGAAQMAGLTAADSPLLRLLVEVSHNTRFTVLPEAEQPAAVTEPVAPPAGAASLPAAAALAERAGDAAAKALPDTARKALQRRFEALHRLLDDTNGPAVDLIPVLQSLGEVQQQLATLGRSGQPELVAFEMARARMSGQRDALSVLRSSAAQLPQPVGGWFNALAENTWTFVLGETYRHLNQRYQDEVYSFYGQALDKRYPFHAHSDSDVALEDFREFFKAQGIAERFFDSCLKPFVSGEPGRYRLRSVDGYSVPMSRAWLDQMSSVHAIRKSFFANAADQPQVQFKLEPYTLDPAVSRAEFRLGDQVAEYRHGPVLATAFTWPTEVDAGRTALVLDRMEGRPLGIEKNTGPWSLFRLLDLMETESLHGRDVLMLKAEVGGLRAHYLLMAQRSPNPFDLTALRRFRLPAQL